MTDKEDDERLRIVKEVERVLRGRAKCGALENELDFLMGASAVLDAIGLWPPPPRWVFASLRGDSVLDWLDEEE